MSCKILIGAGIGTYTPGDGTRTITLSDLPFTPTIEQIAYIYNKTQDRFYYAPAEGIAKCTLSGNDITIDSSFPPLAGTDKIHIQMWGGDSYGNLLISDTNLAEGNGGDGAAGSGNNFYYSILSSLYRRFSFSFLTTTGTGNTFTINLFATENPDAVLSSHGDVNIAADAWEDVSLFHGSVSQIITDENTTNQVDRWELEICAKYLLIQITVADGGTPDNSIKCWMSKIY